MKKILISLNIFIGIAYIVTQIGCSLVEIL